MCFNTQENPQECPWVAHPAAKPKPELRVSAGIPWTGKSFQKLWQQKLELGGNSPFFVQMWQLFLRGTGWWQCHIQGGLLSLLSGWKVSKKMSFIWGFLQGHPRGGMWNPKFHMELEKLQKQKVCIWNQPDFGNSVGKKKSLSWTIYSHFYSCTSGVVFCNFGAWLFTFHLLIWILQLMSVNLGYFF